ncbi:MAG: hypothetical protein OXG13_18120 [Gemmatimonadaceae bacterium]|nr:hypothetical protein [Gemmatimonadaceae bacterium]
MRATATYSDGHGSGKSAESKATAAVVTAGAADSTGAAADFDGDGFGSGDSRFDLDGSGVVDFTDFFLFADHFGTRERSKLLVMAREMIGLPGSPELQNAPNPFNSRTAITYFLLTRALCGSRSTTPWASRCADWWMSSSTPEGTGRTGTPATSGAPRSRRASTCRDCSTPAGLRCGGSCSSSRAWPP